MYYITLHSYFFNLIFICILCKRKLTAMIPTRRIHLIAKRRNCGNCGNGNATNQSGMWRVQSEYTHEHPETACTLTFDKYLTLFAWLNKLFFVDFAATNETQRDWKKPRQGQRMVEGWRMLGEELGMCLGRGEWRVERGEWLCVGL